MKKFICVLPFLFIGFKPYNQVKEYKEQRHNEMVVKKDSLVICVECEALKVIEYKKTLDSLESRRLKLKKDLLRIKKRNEMNKKNKELFKTQLNKIQEMALDSLITKVGYKQFKDSTLHNYINWSPMHVDTLKRIKDISEEDYNLYISNEPKQEVNDSKTINAEVSNITE